MIERKGQPTEIGTVWKSVSFRKLSFATEDAFFGQTNAPKLIPAQEKAVNGKRLSTFTKEQPV